MAAKKSKRPTVRSIRIDGAADLVTIDESSAVWRHELRDGEVQFFGSRSTIVRVRPPEDAKEDEVGEVCRKLGELSCVLAVKMLPRRRSSTVVRETSKDEEAKVEGVRSIAMRLVDEANTSDREGLRKIVDQALHVAGL